MDKEPIFKFKMKVRDYELDTQGIVNNATYLNYYEVARHEFFIQCGTSFLKLQKQGIDAVVSHLSIRYRKSLGESDEFFCTVNLEKDGIRYYFNQKIIRISDEEICSEARVEVVCLVNGRLSEPHTFDELFSKYI